MSEVKYLGDGTPVLVVGDGAPFVTSTDGGRTNTEVPTKKVFRLDGAEDVDADALLDTCPPLHPDTGRPMSDTEPEPDAAAAKKADTETYTDNGDGTWQRNSDGAHGTFGPQGFVPSS